MWLHFYEHVHHALIGFVIGESHWTKSASHKFLSVFAFCGTEAAEPFSQQHSSQVSAGLNNFNKNQRRKTKRCFIKVLWKPTSAKPSPVNELQSQNNEKFAQNNDDYLILWKLVNILINTFNILEVQSQESFS